MCLQVDSWRVGKIERRERILAARNNNNLHRIEVTFEIVDVRLCSQLTVDSPTGQANWCQPHSAPSFQSQHAIGADRLGSHSPGLQILDATQQIHVAGRILFDHIFYVVRAQRFAKLAPGYEIFNLTQSSNCVFVLLCQHAETFRVVVLVLVCCGLWFGLVVFAR